MYRAHTTGMLEHSHGVAWTADLLAGDRKIGTIEQGGYGGADTVHITDPADRVAWNTHCAGLPGKQEQATYLLICAEDGQTPDTDIWA